MSARSMSSQSTSAESTFSQRLSLDLLRKAQHSWAGEPLPHRLRVIRKLRDRIAARAETLLDAFPTHLSRTRADSLTAEIIPLAEACRFLELRATRILATEKISTQGRPLWLGDVHVEVRHEPHGVVLIIGPSNYPLFLIAVQAVQALVAGNAVLIKPGRGGGPVARAFANLASEAGLPADVLVVLDETVEAASDALQSGVNKVVLTGSVQSGRAVLREAARQVIPVTAELSGSDAVFIQRGADVQRAAAAVAFGTTLNGGETCIAPRRVYVHKSLADSFRAALSDPQVSITAVDDDDEALDLASRSHFALGATVFGEEASARRLAARINAGVVVINDMIVPTADDHSQSSDRPTRQASPAFGTRPAQRRRIFPRLSRSRPH